MPTPEGSCEGSWLGWATRTTIDSAAVLIVIYVLWMFMSIIECGVSLIFGLSEVGLDAPELRFWSFGPVVQLSYWGLVLVCVGLHMVLGVFRQRQFNINDW